MRHLCMPEGLSADDTAKLEGVICSTRPILRGEALFRAGDVFESLFAIRSGSLKTVVSHEGGREQVTGLYLSGDALGLDGIGENTHICDAIALEDSSVCLIPYALFERVCRETGAIQRRLHQMMSREIVRETSQMMTLGTLRADERVARLLLDLSARFTRRGYAAAEFTLRLTRDEMGSYLGITLETVSRTLSRFQKLGLIDARGKLIRIRDFDGLRGI
ncbi:Crp/Fnr family transcriptional regulator [Caballeronia glathei]|uniref:Crp/Fnr family transcriptional regulator n=2 Tax=Caballeronia glathei TaxID=60547 RepID=A0A069PFE2_9BURK|nr:Crp/Fnr family transcriptional regulator [Caballeronia glathei]